MGTLPAVKSQHLSLPPATHTTGSGHLRGLPWPLPALLAWGLSWGVFALGQQLGLAPIWAWLLAALSGGAVAVTVPGGWRRALLAAGFPLSSLALGAAVPPWLWLVAAVPLLLAYPLRAWADAPFFPTPARALQPLAATLNLPPGARVLDAGCGLGHGLRALHRLWPQAQVEGVEWSAPMAWLCARRCSFARVRRGDMWSLPWGGHGLVYLFQRPESMARAWTKACTEMAPGSWLVSLEFPIPGVQALHRLDAGAGRPLWVYRVDSSLHKLSAPVAASKKARHGR
jgi:SAM-dependent methyltransferase